MTVILDSFRQYTADYWEVHRGIPGGSDASSIITAAKGDYARKSTRDGLIAKLLADRIDPMYGWHDEVATRAMRQGILDEPAARKSYEFDSDCEVREVGLVLTDDRRFCCSPDGLVGDDGLVELKRPTLKVHMGYCLAGTLPNDYRPQVHWNLIVTERKWCDWISWNPLYPALTIRVEPDEYTEKLRGYMERFAGEYEQAKAKIDAGVPLPETPEPVVISATGFEQIETTPQDAYW